MKQIEEKVNQHFSNKKKLQEIEKDIDTLLETYAPKLNLSQKELANKLHNAYIKYHVNNIPLDPKRFTSLLKYSAFKDCYDKYIALDENRLEIYLTTEDFGL